MGWIMPEIVVQRVLETGIQQLRQNPTAFNDIFSQYAQDELASEYGTTYIDKIREWFFSNKVPVVQAWSLNTQRIPCISVHLATESEDESKAALNDYVGLFDDVAETGTAAFTVTVDIGVHATKSGDHVLWLYYITSYILFKFKPMADRLGLKLHTYSASDYNKDTKYLADNVFSRWIKFRCTTQNFWAADDLTNIDGLNTDPAVMLPPASDIAATDDVDIANVDTTANQGLKVSTSADPNDEEDLSL